MIANEQELKVSPRPRRGVSGSSDASAQQRVESGQLPCCHEEFPVVIFHHRQPGILQAILRSMFMCRSLLRLPVAAPIILRASLVVRLREAGVQRDQRSPVLERQVKIGSIVRG
jgi:hypothetical protein